MLHAKTTDKSVRGFVVLSELASNPPGDRTKTQANCGDDKIPKCMDQGTVVIVDQNAGDENYRRGNGVEEF